jgi:hypothetical protein
MSWRPLTTGAEKLLSLTLASAMRKGQFQGAGNWRQKVLASEVATGGADHGLSLTSCSEAGSEMVQWTPSGSRANVVRASN